MAKEFAKKFYKSKAWLKCRESYIGKRILIDGGMCEKCHKNLGYILHHKIALTPDNIGKPEVTLSHDNLEYVCKDCHDREEGHFIGRQENKYSLKCAFGSDGQPLPPIRENE